MTVSLSPVLTVEPHCDGCDLLPVLAKAVGDEQHARSDVLVCEVAGVEQEQLPATTPHTSPEQQRQERIAHEALEDETAQPEVAQHGEGERDQGVDRVLQAGAPVLHNFIRSYMSRMRIT